MVIRSVLKRLSHRYRSIVDPLSIRPPIRYSRQTLAAYYAVLEASLESAAGEVSEDHRDDCIRFLAMMVHCDVAGEVRDARPRPQWPPHLVEMYERGGYVT